MAGRFPYDPHNPGNPGQRQNEQQHNEQQSQQQSQFSAQMRAALGLPAGSGSIEDAIFLQQQQRQQDFQRDLRLRQLLLQEQLGQQSKLTLHERQLRALGEHLQDYPDLSSHYQTLLLNEQLQRQEERAFLEAQAQIRYQDELRMQQLLHQAQQEQQQQESSAQLGESADGQPQAAAQAHAVPSNNNVAMLRELAADSLSGNAVKKSAVPDRKRSPPPPPPPPVDTQGYKVSGETNMPEDEAVEVVEVTPAPAKAKSKKRPAKEPKEKKEKVKKPKAKTSPKPKKKRATSPMGGKGGKGKPPAGPQIPLHVSTEGDAPTILKPAPRSAFAASPHAAQFPAATPPGAVPSFRASPSETMPPPHHPSPHAPHHPSPHGMHHPSPHVGHHPSPLAYLAAHASPHPTHHMSPHPAYHNMSIQPHLDHPSAPYPPYPSESVGDDGGKAVDYPIARHGTLGGLLAAAESDDKEDTAINLLRNFKGVDWPDSDPDADQDVDREEATVKEQPKKALKRSEFVKLSNGFKSSLPQLPQEPLYEGPLAESDKDGVKESLWDSDCSAGEAMDVEEADGSTEVDITKPKTRVVSNVLEYPYPIDVWWPSMSGIRRERKAAGEESDEDAFEEEPLPSYQEPPTLRANLKKIKRRLANDLRPGVLEKIPHCKLHRLQMRKKKNLSVPDLVYCWQVTDIYPNDIMVCCSKCSTWRHAACGGHHKPYSVRENTKTPFVAVCDYCHEEEDILRDFPNAEKRLEKQRTEQTRRGLATTSVMRHASFSKHGGTYKWPLGRVSATHIGGHTRSVNARHDKAEKQWAEMTKKLSSGYACKPRERARVRTKELERLLVSVEDAEAYTDRHNILLFLMRDSMREHPVGLEKERRNIFDPEEDPEPEQYAALESEEPSNGKDTTQQEDGQSTIEGKAKLPSSDSVAQDSKKMEDAPNYCAREGCKRKPRFDSLFCTDACGVSALESDLLRSFEESSDVHPSVLRN